MPLSSEASPVRNMGRLAYHEHVELLAICGRRMGGMCSEEVITPILFASHHLMRRPQAIAGALSPGAVDCPPIHLPHD
jgi:hypothetical protein